MTEYVINCDGACKGNPGPGGWGVCLSKKNEQGQEEMLHTFCGGSKSTTNNIMELTAAIEAMKLIRIKDGTFTIRTDSSYVMTGITEWIIGWKRKGWRTAKGDPIKNKELWVELDTLHSELKSRLKWEKVKGHSGDWGNDYADMMANQGVSEIMNK